MSDVSQMLAGNRPKRRSIGTLLIWAVNVPLVVVLAVLLPMDYCRELEDAIAAKQASLEEVAMSICQGLSSLAQDGRRESVQQYIDSVCAHMQESRSPGHHIAVRFRGSLMQAETHHRASPQIVRVMQQAAKSSTQRATFGEETLVVGAFAGNGVEVFVSENTSDIRRSVQREIFLHLIWLASLAVAAVAIVNAVLWRIVTCPVRHLSNTVSCIAQGDYELKTNGFRSREMNDLSAAIQRMSETLAANQQDRHAQMERAQRIQEHLLPNGVVVPGLVVAHLFQPAEEVGGDYYDLIRLSDYTWLVCVADVAGHGVAAAMGSAMLKALVLHAAERHCEPAKIMQFVNQRLPALLSDEYITMFLARWVPERRQLDYASAGHEPGLLLSPVGDASELPATGLPLGIDRDADWGTESIDLLPSHRLLLTTDGVAEASDSNGHFFGRKRLAEIASNCAALSPGETVEVIRDAVSQHEDSSQRMDDVTVLVIDVALDISPIIEDPLETGKNTAITIRR